MPILSFELVIEKTEQVEKVTRSALTYFYAQGVQKVKVLGFAKQDVEPGKHWSLQYDRCIVCGRTDRKHMGGGRCSRCYFIGRPKKSHRCENPKCRYEIGDYRPQDMIEHNGKLYCCDECQLAATEESN